MTTETPVAEKSGNLSIHTENIFPIIKKFLYSDQEVFLRELVSNAVDATQKLKTLASVGELAGDAGDLKIVITLDKAAGTLTITDHGIGMTEAEVEQYINQIAFSSAEEFLGKYKDTANQIIGHFGLGFYSAFMVADVVEIETLSYRADATPVHWRCEGSTTFTLGPGTHSTRGTSVILHIPEAHAEFLEAHRISEILKKHCRFLPIEVEFEGQVINNTQPIWTKKPADLTDQDYKDFYQELYPFSEPPLFWIHLNVDFPFTLTGVLYFPVLKPGVDFQKNKIQLYANQVFITDEVADLVPDYLTLLHGVLDSPDIPLNVSRSYLQTDANVRKISGHITKKVADKLNDMFQTNRADFEAKWESIGVFVKYGMVRDNTFYERAEKFCLVADTEKKYYTLPEYKDHISARQTDKNGNLIYLYTDNPQSQHSYIQAAQKRGYDVLVLDGIIDPHFISFIESKLDKARMVRVDADTIDKLIDKGLEKVALLNEQEQADLKTIFERVVTDKLAKLEYQALGENDFPVLIVRPEQMRRMKEMAQGGAMYGVNDFFDSYNVVINSAHPFARKVLLQPDAAAQDRLVQQAYDLARLQQDLLKGPALSAFIDRNLAAIGG